VQSSDFMKFAFLYLNIFAASIFSASAGVTTGEPRFMQHLAHFSARQSSRIGSVAGFKRRRPLLLALKTVFKRSHFIFQLSLLKNSITYRQAGTARKLPGSPRAAGMQGTGFR